jgi:hypothetical protein
MASKMEFSRILICLVVLQAFGLGLAGVARVGDTPDPSVPPKGMDIADLKNSMDAVLGETERLVERAKKAKDPMVQDMAKQDFPFGRVEFDSYDKAGFIKKMSEGRSERPAMYWSDEFLKGLVSAATGDENWNLFTMTTHDGIPGYFGDMAEVYTYMVRWNAKTSKVDVVIYAGFMPVLDEGLLYSFQGTAKLPEGKIYEDSQVFDGKWKPMTAAGISVSDQKSWFDIMQLFSMHGLNTQLENPPKTQSAPVRFLQKASSG